MAEFDKKGTGTLSENERKTEAWHPEQRGSGVWFDGTEFWIDAKEREGRNGGKFLSLKFKLKDGETKKVQVQVTPDNLDDEIPF